MTYTNFFSRLGFDFGVHLKAETIRIEKEAALSQKLKNAVYFYQNPNNTNTSFYLVTSPLEETELEKFRKYVWNKNDVDIIFYYPNDAEKVEMLYAKYSPKVSKEESILEIFSTTQEDLATIEKIRHWQFDSGAFWLNYHSFIDKSKYKEIDKELIATLEALKDQLGKLLTPLISDENEKNNIVQALIDRTLYIKYLEDNHIINSYFFNHYFGDDTLSYEKLLENNSNTEDINKLYEIIHEIFNNALFDQPKIEDRYLTDKVRKLIATSFKADLKTGQLRLFDFSFDVLPVEFISYIYEVFLSKKQKENGIYYTPKKLAQLIVDDVIKDNKIGSILDPSCGSGMFLIVGFQKLLEIARKQVLEPEDSIEKIRFRTELLAKNIFGIEKEPTAQRLTLFSLSLQIFTGIDATDIKDFIARELKENNKVNLFKEFDFYKNIIQQNTLNTENKAFEKKKFNYIVGNPPFVRKEVSQEAKDFTNNYELDVLEEKIIAKDVIDGYQLSQCFLLKIKEWSDKDTRFGFIVNSSNFYNEAQKFQNFFYSHYGIEKIYELSRVKEILFEKAKESVVAIIFTNNFQNNTIDYYPVELGLFSEKPFELLIIQEDKVINISQSELIQRKIRLRDFLVGNRYDNDIIRNIRLNSDVMDNYLDDNINYSSFEGLKRISNADLMHYYNIDYKLSNLELEKLHLKFSLEKYLSFEKQGQYQTPFIFKPEQCIKPYKIYHFTGYINSEELNNRNFQRVRNNYIYEGKKILLNRYGTEINAVYVDDYLLFSNLIYGIKLKEDSLYYVFLSLLNSKLINYYLNLNFRHRADGNFSNITTNIIRNVPIPKKLDQEIVRQISNLGQKLTEGKYEYSDKEQELNELIFDLYELSYWERQRIRDYFLPQEEIGGKSNALKNYKNTLKELLEFYIESPITIEDTSTDFKLIVVKISFVNNNTPRATKVKYFWLNEIFEQNPNANFLASQEKIFGKDCVYIIKKNVNTNWTETKAFEDGQDILKHLIPNENE